MIGVSRRVGGKGREQSGMGLPVVMSPDQTAGILHSAEWNLNEKENSWQPVGNPYTSCQQATLRNEERMLGNNCYFVTYA